MKSYLFLVSIVLLVSCKKRIEEREAIIPGKLHKEYYHKNADQVRVFTYSNKGRLIKYEYFFDQIVAERHEFFYTGNKLTRINHFQKDNNSNALYLYEQKNLEYDGQSRLIVITINYSKKPLPGLLIWPSKYEFLYEGSSTLFTTMKMYDINGSQTEAVIENIYEHDSRGNIVRLGHYQLINGVKQKKWVSFFTYSTIPNPKYHLEDPLDLISYFSPDVCISNASENFNQIIVSYTREYQVDGNGRAIYFSGTDGEVRWFEYY